MVCFLDQSSETETMKNKPTNFILLLVILFSTCDLFGQAYLQKGSSMLGGGFGIDANSSNEKPTHSVGTNYERDFSSFRVSPYYGRFIKDNLAVGFELNFSTSTTDNRDINSNSNVHTEIEGRTYGGGVFLKKYFPILEKFGVFIQPGIKYSFSKSEDTRTTKYALDESSQQRFLTRETDVFSITSSLGLYYFLSPRFSIETNLGSVGFTKSNSNVEETNSVNDELLSSKADSNNLSFDFINRLTFDKIFVINYFF